MFFRKRYRIREKECVLPQSDKYLKQSKYRCGRTSLCALKRGSLTVEAALIVPFFLTILLAFYHFFFLYASAAELKVQAAADVKRLGIVVGSMADVESADLVTAKTRSVEPVLELPFVMKQRVTQRAVCRGWIGFTELNQRELQVYKTVEGSVYHLYSDCTHLNLSIQSVSMEIAQKSKNEYGARYRECELCDGNYGETVYITSEGNCYHSERTCSGLKRTLQTVSLSEVSNLGCCLRCAAREDI